MNKHSLPLLSILLLFLFSNHVMAQTSYMVTVDNFPLEYQLYPRNRTTNQAMVQISGSVNELPTYSRIYLKIYRQQVLLSTSDLTLSGQTFNYSYPLPAELANYNFELYGYHSSTGDILIKSASNVVAGDVIAITGQSNAESTQYNGDANTPNSNYRGFVRVFGKGNSAGTASTWFVGNGNVGSTSDGNTGQWGMKLAALIAENHTIPVAIMNGAAPGQPISYFQKAPSFPNNNYGRLLSRMTVAGLKDTVQALYFHQGESDAIANQSITYYKTQLNALLSAWKGDYPNLKYVYLFQIRTGCSATAASSMNIIQAQKEFADEHPQQVRLISTNNTTQNSDNCHFPYINGYDQFARRAYWQIRQDLYQQPLLPNQASPYPSKALTLNGENKVYLELRNKLDTYTLIGNLITDLRLEGMANYTITDISLLNNILSISYDKIPASGASPTGITLVSHSGAAAPALANANGIGLISFSNMPIEHAALVNQSPSQIRTSEQYWVFGNKARLDFNTSGSSPATSSQFGTHTGPLSGGYATATDLNGNILFYSSAAQTYDRNGNATPGGSMSGNVSATQGVIILPHLGNPDRYISLYTTANTAASPNGSLKYAIFDVNQNGRSGDLIAKDQNPHPTNANVMTSEALTCVPNATGDGFWVVSYINNSTSIYAIEVTFPGGDAIAFSAPVISLSPLFFSNGFGSIEFTKNYAKAIVLSAAHDLSPIPGSLSEFNFNAASGTFSHLWNLNPGALASGNHSWYYADYSPAENYVFVSSIFDDGVKRFNITSGNGSTILSTAQGITEPNSTAKFSGAIRTSANGRTYIASHQGAGGIWEINNPDEPDTDLLSITQKSFGNGGSGLGFSQTTPGIAVNYGDAPASYKTVSLDDGPRHRILYNTTGANTLALGSTASPKSDGTPSLHADIDTDDGVLSFPAIFGSIPSTITSYSVNVSIVNRLNKDATLKGWIDWNNNGSFDFDEVATTLITPDQTSASLTWTDKTPSVQSGITATYARFRISTDSNLLPTGGAPDGEVEDYQIAFTSCVNAGSSLAIGIAGHNTTAGFVTVYVLTDQAGTIISSSMTGAVTAPSLTGSYRIYAVNYNTGDGNINPVLTAGTLISGIGGSCSDISAVPLEFCVTVPLPVTLVSFTAMKENNFSQLRWITSKEINSSRFEIERSQNGKSWNKIATVAALSKGTADSKYSFLDRQPTNGENLYRLKMIDQDETFTYSRIQNVTFDKIAAIALYPNPVLEKLFVSNISEVKSLVLYNAAGRRLIRYDKITDTGIDLSGLTAGLYLVSIKHLDETETTQKIIVTK